MKTRIFLLLVIVCGAFTIFTPQLDAISLPKLKGKVASVAPYQQLSSVADKGPVVLDRVRTLSILANEILDEGDGSQEKTYTIDFDDGNRSSTLLIALKRESDKERNQGSIQISIASLHPFDQRSFSALPLFQLGIFSTEKQMDIGFEIETNVEASLQTDVPERIAPRGGLVSINDDEHASIRQIEIPGSTLPPLPEFDEAALWNLFSRAEISISEILSALKIVQEESKQREYFERARQRALLQILSFQVDTDRDIRHTAWRQDALIAQHNGAEAFKNALLSVSVGLLTIGIGLTIFGNQKSKPE